MMKVSGVAIMFMMIATCVSAQATNDEITLAQSIWGLEKRDIVTQYMKLTDAESGRERWVDTSDGAVRAEFVRYWKDRRDQRRNLFVRSKVDAIPVRIDRPYIKPIVDFFKRRESRL